MKPVFSSLPNLQKISTIRQVSGKLRKFLFTIFNLFIPALLTENIYGRYGTVTKHSCVVAKLAYVLLNFWLDNVFRTLHLGHHQVYKMFIRIYWRYGADTKHSCIVAKLAYVLLIYWFDNMFRPIHLGHHQVYKMFIRIQVNYKNSSWLEYVWTSCRPDDDPNEGFETCCLTKNSIKRRPI